MTGTTATYDVPSLSPRYCYRATPLPTDPSPSAEMSALASALAAPESTASEGTASSVPAISGRLTASDEQPKSAVPRDTAFLRLSEQPVETVQFPESQPPSVTLFHHPSPPRFIPSDQFADSNRLLSPDFVPSDSAAISSALPSSDSLFTSALFAATQKSASDWLPPSQLAISVLTASAAVGLTAVAGRSVGLSVSEEIGRTVPALPVTAELRQSPGAAATDPPAGSPLVGPTAQLFESDCSPCGTGRLSVSAVWPASWAALATAVAVSYDFGRSRAISPTVAEPVT
jgi:hypothetical protein